MRGKKNKEPRIFEQVEITGIAAEGKAIARCDGKVVFVPYAAPGDVVDVLLLRRQKNFYEGKILKTHQYSIQRIQAVCPHFGVCGGCKWQHLPYSLQLEFKQQQVIDALERIGKVPFPPLQPIIPSPKPYFYRNKLEFTFSARPWIDFDKPRDDADSLALGFHTPGMFDKVLDLQDCSLQPQPSNAIRLAAREIAVRNELEFYNQKSHEGFLRNLIVRNNLAGEFMVIAAFGYEDEAKQEKFLSELQKAFPQIVSLMYFINPKLNDSFSDLPVQLFSGRDYLIERIENLQFKIGPKSFFQTNSEQAYELYKVARDFAGLQGNEIVYDLFTGTGTIANFVAAKAKLVVGIEIVAEAIEDAKLNSELNGITNTRFIAGTVENILDKEFFAKYGAPDVIIIDPPRAGMHPKVIKSLLENPAPRLVYVSCNPATQARDIALLSNQYAITKVQPVDMFPQTHHVENVLLLERIEGAIIP